MKKNHLSFPLGFALLFALPVFSQSIAINSDGSMPDSSAILDIKSYSKGLLIPRTGTAARLAMHNTKGLLVYDTSTSSFWYNTGAIWQNMASTGAGSSSSGGWSLIGNSGTRDSGFFIGTTDSASFVVKTNNFQSGRIDPDIHNVFWGYKAGIFSQGTISQSARDSGNFPALTAIGYNSMYSNTSGLRNTAIGASALYSNLTGSANTAIGYNSLYFNTSVDNTATGQYSMYYNTTGGDNSAYGDYALLHNISGNNNMASGHQALVSNTTGDENAAFGANSMYHNTTGHENAALGYFAGEGNTDGSLNTFLGSNTSTFGTYTNSTAIGYGAQINASNKIRLGNASVTVIEGQVPFTTPSDGRFKYAVQEDVKGLDFILKLRPVTYRFDVGRFDAQHGNPQEVKGTSNTNYALQAAYNEASLIRRSGFIAQEVEKAAQASGYDFSGITTPKTEQDHYGLSYESFVVPLVKAVQEQQKTIDVQNKKLTVLQQLQQTVDAQKEKITVLQQQLDEIKQLLQRKN